MIVRQVRLARRIAAYIEQSAAFELLAILKGVEEGKMQHVYNIVLFRAIDTTLNEALTKRINATRIVYVSGTRWEGLPATRFAIANWQVDVDGDFEVVRKVLESVCG